MSGRSGGLKYVGFSKTVQLMLNKLAGSETEPIFVSLRQSADPIKNRYLPGGALPPQTSPLMASPVRLSMANFDFPKIRISEKFRLWEILFMVFLTHRNLPETRGSHISKNENFQFRDFFCINLFFTFFRISGLL